MALLSFRYFYFALNVFASLNFFLHFLKYFCFSSIFIQIFFAFLQIFALLSFKQFFPFLQIFLAFLQIFFCFSAIIFLLSFKYILQIILLPFKKVQFSSNVLASLQRFLYYFRFYCFALKLFSLLSSFKFYCFPLKLFSLLSFFKKNRHGKVLPVRESIHLKHGICRTEEVILF